MTQLTLRISNSSKAYYLRLAQAIVSSIKSGQVLADEKLPSTRALAEQLQVNRHTIMRSYAELVAHGWVVNIERSHYRVSSPLPIDQSLNLSAINTPTAQQFNWQVNRKLVETNFIKSTAHFQYNFAGGRPDTRLFPFAEYRSHLNDALKRPNLKALNYGDNQGDPTLIRQGLKFLRRSRGLQNKQLIITNGSQEALYIVAQLLLTANDKVAVESLGYPPAWQAFQAAGAQLIAVEQDQQGIKPAHLRDLARQSLIKCIYLTPLHQYPTTVTLSPSRRAEIYQIALQYQLFIIEDDYDHEFHYKCQPLPPMAASDPANIVIYLSSFSKIMFPAARAGMLVVPRPLLKPLINLRTTINHKPPVLLQEALARWMESEGFDRHIRRCNKTYLQRFKNALLQLELAKQQGVYLQCKEPDGGMALWINTQINTQQLATELALQSVYIQHQAEFVLPQSTAQISYFRLGCAGQTIEEFNFGFKLIVKQLLKLQDNGIRG